MTGLRGGPPADHLRAPAARRWWAASDRPGFWFLASLVFAGNALFSIWQRNWWLALMQVVTALLAVRAAVFVDATRKDRDGSASGTDRDAPSRGNAP